MPAPRQTAARAMLRALRPQQWLKNTLLFVPLLLAHTVLDLERLRDVALGFAAFCLCASGGYVLNDLLDREADRQHPRKRARPFASGTLSARQGALLAAALTGGGLALSLAVGAPFAGMLVLYLALTISYSLWLKEKLFLDVLLLSALYSLRVLAGAVAARVDVSHWLLGFSLFLFLSLAFVKRYCELRQLASHDGAALARRSYRREDLGLIQTLGSASGYLSVLVLALNISSSDVARLYATPQWLWAVCPVLLYWLTRIWFLAGRGELPDDPVLFAAGDAQSWAALALIALSGVAATW
jgi:4-hydroxybenzoate polyprenyltransferase